MGKDSRPRRSGQSPHQSPQRERDIERKVLDLPEMTDDIVDLNSPMEVFYRPCVRSPSTERLIDPVRQSAWVPNPTVSFLIAIRNLCRDRSHKPSVFFEKLRLIVWADERLVEVSVALFSRQVGRAWGSIPLPVRLGLGPSVEDRSTLRSLDTVIMEQTLAKKEAKPPQMKGNK